MLFEIKYKNAAVIYFLFRSLLHFSPRRRVVCTPANLRRRSKRVVHQVFGHFSQSVFDQCFHDGQPTGVSDRYTAPPVTAADPHQSPEQTVRVFDATVVPVGPVDGHQRFGRALHVAVRRVDHRVVHQPAEELDVRPARGHRRRAVRFRVPPQTPGHVVHQPAADPATPFRTERVVKVQRSQHSAQRRHVGTAGGGPVADRVVHEPRRQVGVHHARGRLDTLEQPTRIMAQPVPCDQRRQHLRSKIAPCQWTAVPREWESEFLINMIIMNLINMIMTAGGGLSGEDVRRYMSVL